MAYYGSNNPSRLGLDSGGGAGNEDLFLKVFSGEVLTTFESNNIMLPLHRSRTISSGKTAQFPVTGVAAATYHTPGESLFADEQTSDDPLYLSKLNHSERTIAIDGVLTASSFLANIDEAKNHYEVRSIYSTEIGRQLAYAADKNVIRTVIAGARKTTDRFGTVAANTAAQIASPYLGGTLLLAGTDADASAVNEIGGISTHAGDTDVVLGADWVKGIFKMAELMDSKNVPEDGRFVVMPPEHYYKLIAENTDALNRDYNPEGNGSVASGEIVSVAGCRILKSNHIPMTDESASALHSHALVNNDVFAADSGYGANCANTIGLGFQTEAVGTVKLMDLAMESEYMMERLGTLLMARYAMGHGVLREEACFEFSKDVTT
jgi:hypothetical protein